MKPKLQLPESASSLPFAIAICALAGYLVLDFENIFFPQSELILKNFLPLKSFINDVERVDYIPFILLYLIQFCVYGVSIIPLIKKIKDHKNTLGSSVIGVITIIILVFIFTEFTVTTNSLPKIEINNFKTKIHILVMMGIVVSACIAILLFMHLKILDGGIKEITAFVSDKTTYFTERKKINSLIFLFGVIISLATLATAAIQKIAGAELIAKQTVYYYGILGSVLMCVIYLPLYFKYKTLGYYLIQAFAEEQGIKKDAIEYISFYKKMEDELGLNASVKDNIIESIPILAPAAAAILNGF